jgi:hypothetical protein
MVNRISQKLGVMMVTGFLLSGTVSGCCKYLDKDKKEDKKDKEDDKDGDKIKVGTVVLAPYTKLSYYEGTVTELGDKATIKWSDNTKPGQVDASKLMNIPKKDQDPGVAKGDFVLVKSSSTSTHWSGGEVEEVGDKITVKFCYDGHKKEMRKHEVVKAPAEIVDGLRDQAARSLFDRQARAAGHAESPKFWKPRVGLNVLAIWGLSSYYEGKVTGVTGGKYVVSWEGSSFKPSTLDASKVSPMPLGAKGTIPQIGNFVVMRPSYKGGMWSFGQVKKVSGRQIEVKLSDGKIKTVEPNDYSLLQP